MEAKMASFNRSSGYLEVAQGCQWLLHHTRRLRSSIWSKDLLRLYGGKDVIQEDAPEGWVSWKVLLNATAVTSTQAYPDMCT